MADINALLDKLIPVEGGYVNNPNDRGGPTNFGITEVEARAYGYVGNMQSFPLSGAKTIYQQKYWTRPGFDKVNAIMPNLAAELFDCGVNMGPQAAATFLQRGLNVLNRQQGDYPDIKADGDIGPMTIYSIQRLLAKRGQAAEGVLLKIVNGLRLCRYVGIAEANPSQETFEWGWVLNRVS